MKKSGTLASFALFGMVAELLFLALTFLFFDVQIAHWKAIVSIVIASLMFIGYRHIIDWTVYDNQVENKLRRIAIGEQPIDRLLFASIGGYVVLLANFQITELSVFKVFLIGVFSTLLTVQAFETARKRINAYQFTKMGVKKSEFNRASQIATHHCPDTNVSGFND